MIGDPVSLRRSGMRPSRRTGTIRYRGIGASSARVPCMPGAGCRRRSSPRMAIRKSSRCIRRRRHSPHNMMTLSAKTAEFREWSRRINAQINVAGSRHTRGSHWACLGSGRGNRTKHGSGPDRHPASVSGCFWQCRRACPVLSGRGRPPLSKPVFAAHWRDCQGSQGDFQRPSDGDHGTRR